MQRAIYVCLGIAALFYVLPFALAVSTSFKSLPDFAQNASSLLWDRALGSPTLDGLRGLDSERIIVLALAVQLRGRHGVRRRSAGSCWRRSPATRWRGSGFPGIASCSR